MVSENIVIQVNPFYISLIIKCTKLIKHELMFTHFNIVRRINDLQRLQLVNIYPFPFILRQPLSIIEVYGELTTR